MMAHSGACVAFPTGSAKAKGGACVKCGKPCPPEPSLPVMERDMELERWATRIAQQAANIDVPRIEEEGVTPPSPFDLYADSRMLPGPWVLDGRDFPEEGLQEAGDGRAYMTAEVTRLWERVQAGDSEACAKYAQCMGALMGFAIAFHFLTHEPS